jgi:hypothetical protein
MAEASWMALLARASLDSSVAAFVSIGLPDSLSSVINAGG